MYVCMHVRACMRVRVLLACVLYSEVSLPFPSGLYSEGPSYLLDKRLLLLTAKNYWLRRACGKQPLKSKRTLGNLTEAPTAVPGKQPSLSTLSRPRGLVDHWYRQQACFSHFQGILHLPPPSTLTSDHHNRFILSFCLN